ncbi:MAG TPA: hypothetical protein VG742_13005 [Dongiaceae bacterium]|nr:hypothetical protein [Dongiaceae bacterium]
MMAVAPFIQALDAAAHQAAATETAFRRESAERIRQLERDRSFAFRRLTLMRTIADAVSRAESEELAVAGGVAILRSKLGWSGDSEARSAILTRFAPVAKAAFANRMPKPDDPAASQASETPPPDAPPPDVLDALAAFEAWYDSTHSASFWTLFEQPMPETPLVDF